MRSSRLDAGCRRELRLIVFVEFLLFFVVDSGIVDHEFEPGLDLVGVFGILELLDILLGTGPDYASFLLVGLCHNFDVLGSI